MPGRARAPFFEIQTSSIQGMGAFATRKIRKGTRIIEYAGERITPEEGDARYDDDRVEHPHILLFTVDERTVVDAGVGGNEARYINHACEPNCETLLDGGRVYVVARRTISPGEELTYDYCLQRPGPGALDWEARYACRCGAETCRGTMLAPRPRRRQRGRSRKAARRRTAR
jgi:hypothetical protein